MAKTNPQNNDTHFKIFIVRNEPGILDGIESLWDHCKTKASATRLANKLLKKFAHVSWVRVVESDGFNVISERHVERV